MNDPETGLKTIISDPAAKQIGVDDLPAFNEKLLPVLKFSKAKWAYVSKYRNGLMITIFR